LSLPTKSIYTEEELVSLLKSRDQQAYSYLYDSYAAAFYGVIQRIVGEGEEATDILQEGFVKVWKNIEQYDVSKGKLFTWMLNIMRHVAIDYLRSGIRKKEQHTDSLEPGTHVSGNETQTKVDHLGLRNVLDKLKEEHRIIIELAYYQGYTQEEISKELDIPLGTVKSRARLALAQLRQILN